MKKKKCEFEICEDTKKKMEDMMREEEFDSEDEYINKAIDFYTGYLNQNKNADYLIPVIVRAVRGELMTIEKHISEMLFNMAVEQAVVSCVIAEAVEIDPDSIDEIRDTCAREVALTNGYINFERAYMSMRGEK